MKPKSCTYIRNQEVAYSLAIGERRHLSHPGKAIIVAIAMTGSLQKFRGFSQPEKYQTIQKMSENLFFNFKVDKSTSTVFIEKEFDARVSLVWDAFTKQEILDQWWAPKPLMSKTKYMDFSVGGRRFYAMVTPDGDEIGWQTFHYTSISPKSNFTCVSFFSDKDETPQSPGANWDLNFKEEERPGGHRVTRINITIHFESLQELEKMIEMGFNEGFTVTLNELMSLLKNLKK